MFDQRLFDYITEKNQTLSQFLQYLNPRNPNLKGEIESLYSSLYIEELIIYRDRMTSSKRLVDVPSYLRPHQTVKRYEYTIKVPYTGDSNLFKYHGSRFYLDGMDFGVHKNYVEFQILDECDNAKQVADQMNEFLRRLDDHIKSVNDDVRQYNDNLKVSLEGFISKRLDELARKRKEEKEAGLPPDEDDMGGEITIPLIPKPRLEPRIVSPMSDVSETNYILDMQSFNEVVESITHTATYMENHVKSFSEMGEEQIRDHIVAMLNGMLSIRATGETFNGNGKTDILYPYKEKNLFIGECKIWDGPSTITNGIGQLEGYLGWNDMKASLIIFYKNKDSMTKKIDEMCGAIRSLPNCKNHIKKERGGRFLMCHPQDDKKSYHLELIVFNLSNNST